MHVAPDPLANIRFVLIETSHPGNVGAAARAIKTMGLEALALVAPRCQLDATAHAMAAGADDVLTAATRAESLDQVLADCIYAVAATARPPGSTWRAVPTRFPRGSDSMRCSTRS